MQPGKFCLLNKETALDKNGKDFSFGIGKTVHVPGIMP
jgi:hypothetical protein